jgi:ABC-type multidrug transport system fused ATPase/permease subunit
MRFYEPTSGQILLDGQPIQSYRIASLRRHIGVVAQTTFLFNDSVRNNIAYGMPHATDAQIEAAARAAHAHDFILQLPEGYDTYIGDSGALLSGGQRQRISIARAILSEPDILIFDEATSALDTESERLVQQSLDRLMASTTALVVAHRLSTIQNADLIVVLEQGHIVETGTHDQLMQRQGRYCQLVQMQSFK